MDWSTASAPQRSAPSWAASCTTVWPCGTRHGRRTRGASSTRRPAPRRSGSVAPSSNFASFPRPCGAAFRFVARKRKVVVGVWADRSWRSSQELVVESLMVSLVMVVFDELVDEKAYMSLAKRDHATEALLFDRADEPLGICVEDWDGDSRTWSMNRRSVALKSLFRRRARARHPEFGRSCISGSTAPGSSSLRRSRSRPRMQPPHGLP